MVCVCVCRGRLKTMMVTGDHTMTGVAVSQQLGLLAKSQTTVVFDREAPKKPSDGSPASANLAARATTFAASPLGNGQHNDQDLRRRLAEGSRPPARNNHDSSRVSFAATDSENVDTAAFRASLRQSILNSAVSTLASDVLAAAPVSDSASASSPSIQQAAVVQRSSSVSASTSSAFHPAAVVQGPPTSASGSAPVSRPAAAITASDDYDLQARSASCAPLVQDTAASSAAASASITTSAASLAASSMFFK